VREIDANTSVAALVDEPGPRPVKPVKMLGENLVLFRDEQDVAD
jgi:hypothetical protein